MQEVDIGFWWSWDKSKFFFVGIWEVFLSFLLLYLYILKVWLSLN